MKVAAVPGVDAARRGAGGRAGGRQRRLLARPRRRLPSGPRPSSRSSGARAVRTCRSPCRAPRRRSRCGPPSASSSTRVGATARSRTISWPATARPSCSTRRPAAGRPWCGCCPSSPVWPRWPSWRWCWLRRRRRASDDLDADVRGAVGRPGGAWRNDGGSSPSRWPTPMPSTWPATWPTPTTSPSASGTWPACPCSGRPDPCRIRPSGGAGGRRRPRRPPLPPPSTPNGPNRSPTRRRRRPPVGAAGTSGSWSGPSSASPPRWSSPCRCSPPTGCPGQTATGSVSLSASQQVARTLDQAATVENQGQLGLAAQLYQQVLDAHPDNEVALAQLGWLEYRIGQQGAERHAARPTPGPR